MHGRHEKYHQQDLDHTEFIRSVIDCYFAWGILWGVLKKLQSPRIWLQGNPMKMLEMDLLSSYASAPTATQRDKGCIVTLC
jgi:hypothetical protein